MSEITVRLEAALDAVLPAAVALRRQLHAQPDMSGDESATRDAVLAALPDELRAGVVRVADTGALVHVGPSGPSVGVRGELDGLGVTETSDVEWQSQRPGLMHACGHDVHLAALVALTLAVHGNPDAPPLTMLLQPREETYPSGALDIMKAGVLVEHGVMAMIGAHLQPLLPAGHVSATPGVVNAAADEFEIVINGRGGHAAYPHETRDPVLTVAQVVVALQQVVGRDIDPLHSAVVGVSSIHAGDAANAVPDVARARGTIRTMSDDLRDYVHQRVREVATYTAMAHGCTASVTITRGEPVLDNDRSLTATTKAQLEQLGLTIGRPMRSFGADDFSFYGEEMPALMMFVGVDGGGAGLHSPRFVPPDSAIRDVARAMLAGYLAASELL